MKYNTAIVTILSVLISALSASSQNPTDFKQQFSSIGNFDLENGSKIYDCSLGYRVYGKLNADSSNVIICPTWFTGTTKGLEDVMPGKLIDTASFYLILIDAIGDGVSSSPSNSKKQPRLSFPLFSIRDMVESQYKMLTGKFKLRHLHAITGISMGGMQSFQWAVSHPGYVDNIIPIVGSPQLSSNDLLLWNAELMALKMDTAYHNGNYKGHPSLKTVSAIHSLALTTPAFQTNTVSRDSFNVWFLKTVSNVPFDWNNWHRQLQAMIGHDICKTTNNSMEAAAKIISAKMLIIVSKQDHMVNPIPASKLAEILHAKLLTLEGDCGHIAVLCELETAGKAIKDFLSR